MNEPTRAAPHAGFVPRFAAALQFLTRLPLPRTARFSEALLNESARHFPAVGALIGLLGTAALAAALAALPATVAVLLAIAVTIAATGALHEDGLADTCDALGAGCDRTRALAIMKDSRIGSFGALALALRLALEAAAVGALLERGVLAACALWVAAHGLSRLAPVLLIATLPYAGDLEAARARPLARPLARTTVAVALLWAAALLSAASMVASAAALAAVGALAAVTLALRRGLARWLGGYTGDTLGAAQQLSLLAMLLAAAAVPR